MQQCISNCYGGWGMQDLMEVLATLFITIFFLLDLAAYHVERAYSNVYTPNDEGDILRQKALVVFLKSHLYARSSPAWPPSSLSDVRNSMETMEDFDINQHTWLIIFLARFLFPSWFELIVSDPGWDPRQGSLGPKKGFQGDGPCLTG